MINDKLLKSIVLVIQILNDEWELRERQEEKHFSNQIGGKKKIEEKIIKAIKIKDSHFTRTKKKIIH